jgi:hypothetical protein
MHHTAKDFWKCYYKLTAEIQELADKNFELLKKDGRHPSLHFKKIEELYSVGLDHRALGIEKNKKIYWFWIGDHDEYMRILRG